MTNPNEGFLERLRMVGITTAYGLHKAARGLLPRTFCQQIFTGSEPTVRKAVFAAQILEELLEIHGLKGIDCSPYAIWGDTPEWRSREMREEAG